ncbi:MAG: TolB family protein [Rudaea sp.]
MSDPRQMNGANAAHRDAFACGREALVNLAGNYRTYALVHRVLAWGYFYKDNDLQKAIQEYRTAANLYHSANDTIGESESRMRLGLLLATSSRSQACAELASAGNLNPQNDRALQYYQSYACASVASRPVAGSTPVRPPPAPQVDLAALKGKILFKSDRNGPESYFAMDADGKNVKEVSFSTYQAAGQWESWAQNHSQVASVRNAGFNRKFGYNNDIWITDPQGGNGRPLENTANDYDPAWSPGGLFDGRDWIAFVSNRGDIAHPENQGEELWVMHPDGTNSLRLTCHGPIFSKHPSWSPDSSKLVFFSNYPAGGDSQIFTIDLANLGKVSEPCQIGETIRNIGNSTSNDYEPVWVK